MDSGRSDAGTKGDFTEVGRTIRNPDKTFYVVRKSILIHEVKNMTALFTRSLIIILVLAGAVSAQKRNITEKDLFDFTWIGDPQVSPDGNNVAFVRISVNEKKDGYNTSIWGVSTAGGDEARRLTSGIRDSSPRWSPDGKYLAFVRVTEKDGK